MPRIARFILITRRIIQFIARQILLFILPIPFFPSISALLAKSVGIDPLSLKSFNLPKPLQSIQTITTNLTRFVPKFIMPKQTQTRAAIPAETSISIGEKIRTWRQRHLGDKAMDEKGKEVQIEEEWQIPKPKSVRKKVDEVEFENPIHEMQRVLEEGVTAIQKVPSIRHFPPSCI